LKLRRREDVTFPSAKVFERFGAKASVMTRTLDYCEDDTRYADVAELLRSAIAEPVEPGESRTPEPPVGFVYLLKSGRFYRSGEPTRTGAVIENWPFNCLKRLDACT
jgi:hypothetical protein